MTDSVPYSRYFGMRLWTALYDLQLRTKEKVANLFFPSGSSVPSSSMPINDSNRSGDFFNELSNEDFRDTCRQAVLRDNLAYNLPSKTKFQRCTRLHVPGDSSVMNPDLRWVVTQRLFPSQLWYRHCYDFFIKEHFREPIITANTLVNLLGNLISEGVNHLLKLTEIKN